MNTRKRQDANSAAVSNNFRTHNSHKSSLIIWDHPTRSAITDNRLDSSTNLNSRSVIHYITVMCRVILRASNLITGVSPTIEIKIENI